MSAILTSPLTVDLDELREYLVYRARINNTPLHLITWVRNGMALKATPEQIEEWCFTGLNHIDFPDCHFPS